MPRSEFYELVCSTLTEYNYKYAPSSDEIKAACSLKERRRHIIVLLCGTSGSGKSTLASILASRLGICTVLSTDSVRHMMRGFTTAEETPLLFASTYEAGEALRKQQALDEARMHQMLLLQQQLKQDMSHPAQSPLAESPAAAVPQALDGGRGGGATAPAAALPFPPPQLPTAGPSPQGLSAHDLAIRGYKAQCELISEQLEQLISGFEARRQSLVVEGVHLHVGLVMRLLQRHPGLVPFLVYIKSEGKHVERMAVRAKYMTLDPNKNKYVKNMRNIRWIQDYLFRKAEKHAIPCVENTNIDRSVGLIHLTLLGCLKRMMKGEQVLDAGSPSLRMLHNEYTAVVESLAGMGTAAAGTGTGPGTAAAAVSAAAVAAAPPSSGAVGPSGTAHFHRESSASVGPSAQAPLQRMLGSPRFFSREIGAAGSLAPPAAATAAAGDGSGVYNEAVLVAAAAVAAAAACGSGGGGSGGGGGGPSHAHSSPQLELPAPYQSCAEAAALLLSSSPQQHPLQSALVTKAPVAVSPSLAQPISPPVKLLSISVHAVAAAAAAGSPRRSPSTSQLPAPTARAGPAHIGAAAVDTAVDTGGGGVTTCGAQLMASEAIGPGLCLENGTCAAAAAAAAAALPAAALSAIWEVPAGILPASPIVRERSGADGAVPYGSIPLLCSRGISPGLPAPPLDAASVGVSGLCLPPGDPLVRSWPLPSDQQPRVLEPSGLQSADAEEIEVPQPWHPSPHMVGGYNQHRLRRHPVGRGNGSGADDQGDMKGQEEQLWVSVHRNEEHGSHSEAAKVTAKTCGAFGDPPLLVSGSPALGLPTTASAVGTASVARTSSGRDAASCEGINLGNPSPVAVATAAPQLPSPRPPPVSSFPPLSSERVAHSTVASSADNSGDAGDDVKYAAAAHRPAAPPRGSPHSGVPVQALSPEQQQHVEAVLPACMERLGAGGTRSMSGSAVVPGRGSSNSKDTIAGHWSSHLLGRIEEGREGGEAPEVLSATEGHVPSADSAAAGAGGMIAPAVSIAAAVATTADVRADRAASAAFAAAKDAYSRFGDRCSEEVLRAVIESAILDQQMDCVTEQQLPAGWQQQQRSESPAPSAVQLSSSFGTGQRQLGWEGSEDGQGTPPNCVGCGEEVAPPPLPPQQQACLAPAGVSDAVGMDGAASSLAATLGSSPAVAVESGGSGGGGGDGGAQRARPDATALSAFAGVSSWPAASAAALRNGSRRLGEESSSPSRSGYSSDEGGIAEGDAGREGDEDRGGCDGGDMGPAAGSGAGSGGCGNVRRRRPTLHTGSHGPRLPGDSDDPDGEVYGLYGYGSASPLQEYGSVYESATHDDMDEHGDEEEGAPLGRTSNTIIRHLAGALVRSRMRASASAAAAAATGRAPSRAQHYQRANGPPPASSSGAALRLSVGRKSPLLLRGAGGGENVQQHQPVTAGGKSASSDNRNPRVDGTGGDSIGGNRAMGVNQQLRQLLRGGAGPKLRPPQGSGGSAVLQQIPQQSSTSGET
ncbi:hypothetical protein VOLCADRAFT_105596 [Volvox carteri f. nagariensis]|uniref:Zeta toxin domain-containing protein n=1 Tax=Volvox carteri f. nagariensis TaxID=3068 RepID=D8U1S9_VOLCA|nr:uncharacterized protein VOLCADRAFT_105596 [Volvox carteri f. nagariensis]EFJ46166.1 hypothetical protein VOLCADRAFT_105596 [Volvox carteri f. nagariensis]|eukprot:XP_002952613.1 hypothetical protein VOLCADRAFT_105596 [Volvox carteri f. nagariensis]